MKKIILTLALVAAAATSASAQFGIGAGYLNSSMKESSSSESLALNGAYIEGTYSLPLADGLCFVPGLRYSFATTSDVSALEIEDFKAAGIDITMNEHYVSVPLMFQYGYDLGGAKLFAFAGPTLNAGLASSLSVKLDIAGFTGDEDVDLFKDVFNRFDVSVGGGLGVEFSNIQVKAGYDFGLLNKSTDDRSKLNCKQLRVGVAYLF